MSEEDVLKKIGAQPIKNSGRGMRKGDGIWRHFIVDVKEHKALTLNEKMWAKMCSDAFSHGPEYEPMILAKLPNGSLVAGISFAELRRLVEREDGCDGCIECN